VGPCDRALCASRPFYPKTIVRVVFMLIVLLALVVNAVRFVYAQPGAQTLPASQITDTSAVLNGYVVTNGQNTLWRFTVINIVPYNNVVATCPDENTQGGLVPGAQPASPVSCQVNGLEPSLTYFSELDVCWTPWGSVCASGAKLQFTTLPTSTGPKVTDWALSNLRMTPSSPKVGDQVTLAADLAALSTNAPYPQRVENGFLVDGTDGNGGHSTYYGPTGTPQTITVDDAWTATAGTHTVTWEVDTYAHEYDDPDRSNNQVSLTFTVGTGGGPAAETDPATHVTATSAVLNGVVTTNGQDTHWQFGYWLGPKFEGYCPPDEGQGGVVPGATLSVPVHCQLDGLQPSTTYTFNLAAFYPGATITFIWGVELSFTTLATSTGPTAPPFDFALSVSPSTLSMNQGGAAHYVAGVTYSDPSYAGTMINVQLTGLGPGMDWHATQTGDLTITTSQSTPTGSYSILLTGSANGVTHTTGMTLIVTSTPAATTTTAPSTTTGSVPFDFSVTVLPSTQSVEIGGSVSYVVSVLPLAGSTVPVSLTLVGCPGDVRSSFTTQSANPPYTSTLNLDLSASSANLGSYTLTVVASAAGNIKTAAATLTIQQKAAQTQTTVSQTTTTGLSEVLQQNRTIIIAALVVVLVVLVVIAMRGGRHAVTQQVGASRVFCGKCGAENPASNEFCGSCGNKLKTS
jgi:hypothetical protein